MNGLRVSILAALGAGFAACDSDPSGESSSPATTGGAMASAVGGSTMTEANAPADPPTPMATQRCQNPVEIVYQGTPTGLARCEDKTVNRFDSSVVCEGPGTCTTDADCASPNGEGDDRICLCAHDAFPLEDGDFVFAGIDGLQRSRCVPATCTQHSDCLSGECGVVYPSFVADGYSVMCRGANPECSAESDVCGTCTEVCLDENGDDYNASYDAVCVNEQGFLLCSSCESGGTGCGRPLSVDDGPLLAPTIERDDWGSSTEISENQIGVSERRTLASWWASVGALEHASVASFGRFSLQLMSLGAPPQLLLEVQQAALDEIEHAKLAYGLASHYAQTPLGPGPLALDDVELETEPDRVVQLLIEEACVGEILGVAEAAAAAEHVSDPYVRDVYERIAADEGRHADLAWRSLKWILENFPETRDVATHALQDALNQHAVAPASTGLHLPHLGFWNAAARHRVHREAIVEVVQPLAAHLGLLTQRRAA